VTFTVGSITVFIALMNAPDAEREALTTLTKIWSGGAPIPPSTVKAFQAQFGQYIHNIYGLTETTSPSHGVPAGAVAPIDDASGALSVGVPVYDTVVRIVGDDGLDLPPGEIGEIVTRSDCVMAGYWKNAEATAKALRGGWLHTGDVGSMDAAGFLTIRDRSKDMIISGGSNIYPREIEEVLLRHPAVAEVSVVGRPHAEWGEEVVAFVVTRSRLSTDDLDRLCLDNIARFKRPREYHFVEALPKNNYGKVLKTELRKLLAR
jgi:long-chain acyl-CoA synthetase